MIVAISGTSSPFPRMLEGLARFSAHTGEAIWAQHGHAPLPPPLKGVRFLPRAQLMRKLETAEAVICHGGSGTILDAIRCGHVPIIMPRLAIHREHVDDHQLQIAERLQQEGKAFALTSFDLLESLLTIAKERKGQRVLDAPNALQDALVSTSERLCRNRVASRLRWVALRALTRWLPLPPRSD